MLIRRIYLVTTLVGIIILFLLSFLSIAVFTSNNTPETVIARFNIFSQMLIYFNYILFVVLLIIANIVYYRYSKTIYLAFGCLVFILFINFYYFFTIDASIQYKKAHNLLQGETNLGFLLGLFFSFVAVFLTVLNYFILRNFFKPANHSKE